MGNANKTILLKCAYLFFSQKGVKPRAWGYKVPCFRAKKQHHSQLLFLTLYDYSRALHRNTTVRCANANIPTTSQNAFHL